MYVQIRLRTLLIAVALLVPPLAYSTYHGCLAIQHGYRAFRESHANQAIHDWREARGLRRWSMALLTNSENSEGARRADELREQSDALFRGAYWHFFLSGRSGEDNADLQREVGWVEEPAEPEITPAE